MQVDSVNQEENVDSGETKQNTVTEVPRTVLQGELMRQNLFI